MEPSPRALRLAHRGVHETAVENTVAAMRAAVGRPGIDGVEFDVQASRDRVPVLLHDETLARTFDLPGRVEDYDVADLEAIGVPSLAAALEVLPDTMYLDVELKSDVGALVAPLLEPRLAAGRVVVSSFDADVLRTIRSIAPRIERWLNAEALDGSAIALASELGCTTVSARHTTIDRSWRERAAAGGLAVAAWTATDPATVARLDALGCVAICVEGDALGA
ncbi:MAG TPA: glycerophosphodiester phosphodiesterase [Candidatus Limnocylindrales bacterium]|nr:glycerophosphodiester phosphodiesterase [Candidatus Limnocylindrales bacterium]